MTAHTAQPRIIFLGTPDFAVTSLAALIENGFNVVAVVTAPDKPAGRGKLLRASAVKEYSLSRNLPVLQPEKLRSKTFLEELRSYHADLQIVVAFRMLPEVVWNMPPMGTINVHASLLPDYRGAAPVNWAVINGETETGVTTFCLKHEIDTGNILLQQKVPILPGDNFGILYKKLMTAGAQLLLQTVEGLAGGTIIPKSQPETAVGKHAPKIFKEDAKINWERSVKDIHNLIRGLSPVPAAYTFIKEKQLRIFESSFEYIDATPAPGTMDTDGTKTLRFAGTNGWLYCKEVQLEGKKRMTVEDFLRGYRPEN